MSLRGTLRIVKVAVVGTGYVGLPTGLVLAELGNDVICVDKDPRKVEMLKRGESPIFEPGVEELLKKGLQSGHLVISTDLKTSVLASEIVFIAVGTPPGEDGTPDMRFVKAVASEIAEALLSAPDGPPIVVVNKSTVPVGSGDLVENMLCEKGVPAKRFQVVSNPEFLREGTALWDTQNPDRIVIGAKRKEAADRLVELYRPLNAPYFITDLNSAEMIKYASNSFLAMKISFINAISRLCEACDANVAEVAAGMGADKRIGAQFLQAGLGWGGSCFPKDVQGLIKISEQFGYDFALLKEVWNINEDQTRAFLRRIETRLGGFEGKTVALLGLAFKPNTDDIRDAKSLVIIEEVLAKGGKVRAFDPIAEANVRELFPNIEYVGSVYDVATDADALVLVTEWNEFKQMDLVRLGQSMRSKVLFDGRRVYNRETAEKAGFEYFTIGSR